MSLDLEKDSLECSLKVLRILREESVESTGRISGAWKNPSDYYQAVATTKPLLLLELEDLYLLQQHHPTTPANFESSREFKRESHHNDQHFQHGNVRVHFRRVQGCFRGTTLPW
jgi:hypothetical protein